MVLQLYGSPISICTKSVATILHEKRVPFDFHPVDIFKGEQKAPEFMAHQPFGQVPYIDDDGFILYESRAIARYIALKYAEQGTPLIPTGSDDLKKIALFEQAASIELCDFEPYVAKYVIQKVFTPMRGLSPDEEVASEALATLDAKLDVYDKILSKQAYLSGDDLTIVDLIHLAWGTLVKTGGSDIMESKPNVRRWWKDISSRPAWLAVADGVTGVEKY